MTTQNKKLCTINDCEQPHKARGWCTFHYLRWQRYGDPLAVPPGPEVKPPAERFWSKVDASGDCWEWTAARQEGYGRFSVAKGEHWSAHRWAYEHLVAAIPEGLQLDHLCRAASKIVV